MESAQDLTTDELFVGLTRPATMWGIPYSAFVLVFLATAVIFLAIGNPLWLLMAVPIHGILFVVSASDPAFFSSLFIWMKTIGRCRNSLFWGAASFSPLPLKKWQN
jgi:type IV secretion system protein VirB3